MGFDSLLNKPIDHRHKINDIQGLSEKLEQQNSVGALNLVISTTYSELKTLRDNNNLTPGVFYRIVDYTTTVANDSEARSAGHLFDIVVLAISSNVLSEEALAVKSIRDTDGYFSNANLSAWKIWYCLDNDIYRFTWADIQLGTGVIYRMIDEWGNDCPYDFKNIQFKRYVVSDDSANGELEHLNGKYIGFNSYMHGLIVEDLESFIWAYTFSQIYNDKVVDRSNIIETIPQEEGNYNLTKKCELNTIRQCYAYSTIDDMRFVSRTLNNIVCITEHDMNFGDPKSGELRNNKFDVDCMNITLYGFPENNYFEQGCYNNIMDGYKNTLKSDCYYLTFGQGCREMQFGQYCHDMQFGQDCCDMQFGQGCGGMTFGQNVRYIIFDNNIYNIEIPNNEDSSYVQNAHIFNGVHGNDSVNKLVINLAYNVEYTQFVAMKSDGSVRIWNPADVA